MLGHSEIDRAVEILRAGGLVAFATETVYGLGADATNARAVDKIFAVKGRPAANPLIVHVADVSVARRYVTAWPESARQLAQAFWPGPLTMVLPKSEEIVPAVTAGLATVAIRCPDHPVARELSPKNSPAPWPRPSANRSNRISPTTADHVRRDLGNAVDVILDGGDCRVGIESTVIDLSSPRPAILRPGGISRRQIEQLLGPIEISAPPDFSQGVLSPGLQPVHYAPRAPAFRFDESDLSRLADLVPGRLGRSIVLLIIKGSELAERLRESPMGGAIIEMPGTADEYARRLYAALHEADDRRPDAIWVQQPPDGAPWDAVRDRVCRATRPASQAS